MSQLLNITVLDDDEIDVPQRLEVSGQRKFAE